VTISSPLANPAATRTAIPPVEHAGNNAWYRHHSLRHAAELDAAGRASGSAAATRDIDFIVAMLGLCPADRLLEIGCGWGRHTRVLRERGFARLTSVDIAPALLEQARAHTAGLDADLRECDFRALAHAGPFDALLSLYDRSCIGSSLRWTPSSAPSGPK